MFQDMLGKKVEKILGFNIPDSEKNTIDDLRCLSNKRILELKKLKDSDEYLAWLYLDYLATDINKDFIWSFVFDVIMGDDTAHDWYKDVVIYGRYEIEDIVDLQSIEAIITPLEPFALNHGFSKIEFTMEKYDGGISYTGVPCVELSNYDYRSKLEHPLRVVTRKEVLSDGEVSINKIDNPKSAALRWLVSDMARLIWLDVTNPDRENTDIIELYKQRLPGFKLTKALRSAITVLEKELELIGGYYTNETLPGFTIDDKYIDMEL